MTPLGFDFGQEFSVSDINNVGQAAGYGESWQHGARLVPGQALGWGNLPGYTHTQARGINDLGAMVGSAWNGEEPSRAVRFGTNFTYTLLPTLNVNQDAAAFRVNSAGTAVGLSSSKAVMWTSNNTLINLHSMLPAEATASQATDINDAGWITGHFYNNNLDFRAFRFNFETGMTFFDALPGDSYVNACAINNLGQIVGRSRRTESVGRFDAFIYDSNGVTNLNDLIAPSSGWILNDASDINDNGYIVGRGTFNGVETNYMLKPVPEPGSIMALTIGVAALLRRRSRFGSK